MLSGGGWPVHVVHATATRHPTHPSPLIKADTKADRPPPWTPTPASQSLLRSPRRCGPTCSGKGDNLCVHLSLLLVSSAPASLGPSYSLPVAAVRVSSPSVTLTPSHCCAQTHPPTLTILPAYPHPASTPHPPPLPAHSPVLISFRWCCVGVGGAKEGIRNGTRNGTTGMKGREGGRARPSGTGGGGEGRGKQSRKETCGCLGGFQRVRTVIFCLSSCARPPPARIKRWKKRKKKNLSKKNMSSSVFFRVSKRCIFFRFPSAHPSPLSPATRPLLTPPALYSEP